MFQPESMPYPVYSDREHVEGTEYSCVALKQPLFSLIKQDASS